jgi:hypothetical protein
MDSSDCWAWPDDPHPVLTIDEAADVLDIGRSLAYKLAREYIDSGGTAGMPVIRLGGCLRVPRWALLVLATTGRVVRLCDIAVPWMEQSGVR